MISRIELDKVIVLGLHNQENFFIFMRSEAWLYSGVGMDRATKLFIVIYLFIWFLSEYITFFKLSVKGSGLITFSIAQYILLLFNKPKLTLKQC